MLVNAGVSYSQVVSNHKLITTDVIMTDVVMTDVEFDAWYYSYPGNTKPTTRQSSKKMFAHNKRVDAIPSGFQQWCLERANAGKS